MIQANASILPQVGTRFSMWDGYIEGENIELESDHRILQAWRTTEFPADSPDSKLEILFEEFEGDTKITLIHRNLPDGQGKQYEEGWQENYFEPMKEYFTARKPTTNAPTSK
jgi:activator of HSP90 ATPase